MPNCLVFAKIYICYIRGYKCFMEKYVLITGASSGLGKETAQKLAQEGYKVFAGVRKSEDKEVLEKLHENIIPVFLDVTSDESVNCAFETISSVTDTLFALVNNAGIATGGPIEFAPVEMLKKQFDVNVFGAIRVTQKFLPLLNKNGGDARIINISSMASYGIFPFVSPYCASKRALDIFFNSLLLENKNPNLKIVSIKPGVVATPIWNKSIDAIEESFGEIREKVYEKYGKDLECIAEHARENEHKGLKAEDIADVVSKALSVKNPKLSYNVGTDSCFAKMIAALPLGLSNFLVKKSMKSKVF